MPTVPGPTVAPARQAAGKLAGFGSLRVRLVALVAIALALPVAVVVWQLDRQTAARIEAAKAEMLAAAQGMAREHATILEDARAILGTLALFRRIRDMGADCRPLVQQVARLAPWANVVAVADVTGTIRCTSLANPAPLSIGDRDYFKAALAGTDLVVSDVLAGRALGRPVVVAAQPLPDLAGQPHAVIIIAIDINALAGMTEYGGGRGGRLALLVNPDGQLLAARPILAGTFASPLVAAIDGAKDGVARAADPDGVPRIFGFARLSQSQAWIAVGRTEADVLGPVRRETARVALLLVVAALLTAGIGWWFGEAVLLRGIARIAAAARDGLPLTGAAPDEVAAPEVRALHAALVRHEERREAAERRWRTLGQAGAQIVWRADASGRIIEGPGWQAMAGVPVEALATRDLGGVLHPEDQSTRAAAWQRALETGDAYDVEFRIGTARPDGAESGWRWMHSRGLPVRDGTGAIIEWVGTLRDVDDRRRADAALAERDARLRSVLETAEDAVLVIDDAGLLQEVNPAAERMFGWPAAELLGRDVGTLMPPWEAERHQDHLHSHRKRGGDQPIGMGRELDAQRRDGVIFPVEISVASFRDAAGRGFYTGILRDVSARRAANRAIGESERRFRLLAENSGDVVMLSALDGTRLYVSPSSEWVLGWMPEELVGKRGVDLVHPEDRPLLEAGIEAIATGQGSSDVTYRLRRPDGSWIWVEGRARASLGADGRKDGYVVTLRDATERKIAEARLRDAFEQMERLAATDSLTGLANRRRFDDALRHEWRRAEREELPLSIALIDADKFKLFNDRYGHPAGDDCLRGVAAAIARAARRGGDLPARHGGEEFAMLMPATDGPGAAAVGERIRALVEADRRPHAGNPPSATVTVSVGVATAYPWAPGGLGGPDALLSVADDALYAAKSGGRNRVEIAATEARFVLP